MGAAHYTCPDMTINWRKLSAGAALAVAMLAASPTRAQVAPSKPTEQEAREIGVRAYLYLYPLVTMDITRRQMTNAVKPEGLQAPANTFINVPAYPTANDRVVVFRRDGSFDRQYRHPDFKAMSAFTMRNGVAYVFSGGKLRRVTW